MKQLLLVSDSVCGRTGFSRVAREISGALHEHGWQITQLASNHEDPLLRHEHVHVVDARSSELRPWGEDLAARLYEENNFDALLVIQDHDVAHGWATRFFSAKVNRQHQGRPPCPIVFYFPVDGPVFDIGAFPTVADVSVTYTPWGRDLLKTILTPDVWEGVRVIPHGTDTRTFHRLTPATRRRARTEIFHVYDDETFVVANVNRNTPRKDLFKTLQTLAILRDQLPDPLLYIHAPEFDCGISLGAQMRSLDLIAGRDVLLATDTQLKWSDDALCGVYGGADALLTTSQREGWGLTTTEAMASWCPVVAPDYGPFREHLGDDRGFLFDPLCRVWGIPGDNRGMGWLSDPGAAARQLIEISERRGDLDAVLERAASHVLDWNAVGRMWVDLLGEVAA